MGTPQRRKPLMVYTMQDADAAQAGADVASVYKSASAGYVLAQDLGPGLDIGRGVRHGER
ncbi:hypothetical protein MPRS_23760 [Mycobacterium paraseoulense]|nr:hypothetical protein MPRS_23760 [Mycobacterium paraseoulense]